MSGRSSKKAMKGTLYKKVKDGLSPPKNSNVQIQNVKAARVYVFGDAEVDEEEILNGDVESCELRERGKTKHGPKDEAESAVDMVSIERPILEGETLQKIAVKYCCEMADLKRINNLITDQDFHALTSIKVPVMKHGLVREKLEEEIRQNAADCGPGTANGSFIPIGASSSRNSHSVLQVTESVSDSDWGDMDTNHVSETTDLLVRTVSIGNSLTNQGEDAKNFLQRMDADIKNILSSTKSSKKRNLDEVRSSLTCRRIYPLDRKEGFLGADCGMKLGTVISIIIIVAVVTPLIYYIYYEYIKLPEVHPTQDNGGR